MNKLRLAVFLGGQSAEHDISCLSGTTMLKNLDPDRYEVTIVGITREGKWLLVPSVEAVEDGSWRDGKVTAQLLPDATEKCLLITEEDGRMHKQPVDAALPALHGRFGEDGTIQGLFELARIPYVGCGVAASAVSMDKLYTKVMVARTGVNQAHYVPLTRAELQDTEKAIAKIEASLSYPVFVKPNDGGSSQGVSRADRREDLPAALALAAEEGTRVMVEENIVGREVECAVMTTAGGPQASGVGEILAAAEFYSFDAKYTNPDSDTDLHPDFPEGKEEEIRQAALKVYEAVGAYGLSRVDFFLEKGTNRVIFNEINTLPGFTSISMFPKLWESRGVPIREQLNKLIEGAFQRER